MHSLDRLFYLPVTILSSLPLCLCLQDHIKPKNVVLVAAPSQPDQDAVLAAARAALQPLVFNTAISSAQELPFAQRLWAGRDGPPYFHKVRQRWECRVGCAVASTAALAPLSVGLHCCACFRW